MPVLAQKVLNLHRCSLKVTFLDINPNPPSVFFPGDGYGRGTAPGEQEPGPWCGGSGLRAGAVLSHDAPHAARP